MPHMRYLSILGLFVMLLGCMPPHINYNDPNFTLTKFTEQMARSQSFMRWSGEQIDACTYSIPLRVHFFARGDTFPWDPVESIAGDYERYCTINRKGKFVKQNNNNYICSDVEGYELFSVTLDSRPEEEFFLKTTGKFYRNGNIFVRTTQMTELGIMKDDARFIEEALIEPHVVDESGYYENEELARYNLVRDSSLSCNTKREHLKYSVNVAQSSLIGNRYMVSMGSLPNSIPFSGDKYLFRPDIVVKKRVFAEFYPRAATFNDRSIEFKVLTVHLGTERGIAEVEIRNKTNNYIDLKALSLHFGEWVFSPSLVEEVQPTKTSSLRNFEKIVLPPKTLTKCKFTFLGGFQQLKGGIYDDLNRIVIDKKSAENTSIELGLSAKLDVGGKQSTFFKTNLYTLANVLINPQ